MLAMRFAEKFSAESSVSPMTIESEAMELLEAYNWSRSGEGVRGPDGNQGRNGEETGSEKRYWSNTRRRAGWGIILFPGPDVARAPDFRKRAGAGLHA